MNQTTTRSTEDWQSIDRRHYLHPFSDAKTLGQQGARIITRAEGVYLWDSEGRRMIDGMSGLWCVNVGYGRAELADAGCRQLHELPYYNSFFKTAHPPVLALTEMLVALTPPQFNHVFYTGSGSEANDTVIRLVRRYWDIVGQPSRKYIISREHAYHGSTIASASLGGMRHVHEQGHLPIPGIVHIEAPYWYGSGGDLSPSDFGLKAARAWKRRFSSWDRITSRPLSASPFRAPAACSSRRKPTGRRCSAFVANTTFCWWPTRSSADSAARAGGGVVNCWVSSPT